MTITQEYVEQRITEAQNNTELIEKGVEYWMKKVHKLTQQLDNLEEERRRLGRTFSPRRRYHIIKKMSKKINEMRELINHSKFETISHPTALPGIEYFASGNFKYFESTKLAYNELMEAIKEPGTLMVGLYGMGGSGKTTLIKEVGIKAKEMKLFDYVLITSVSQTPNLQRIQGEIAEMLGLKITEETELGRARRIHLRLKEGGDHILLILDDIWGKLNLEEIGVHQGCKILLTTRLKSTCILMKCQRSIPLGLLSEEESWTFFQHHAQIVLDKPPWFSEDVARKIVGECKGLPIAIEAVGNTLEGKSCDEWNLALYQLKHSKPMDMEEGVRDAFTCLKLSYDYLRNTVAKSLFLMCGLFPEDYDISREDLFVYGMGLGLCKGIDELKIARSLVNSGINNLIESSLLTHSQKGEGYLKMHDIVRDVSLWIGKTQGKIATSPNDEDLSECYAISSWNYEGDHFPHEFDAPKLEVLLINTSTMLSLSNTSFHCMKVLKVLAIINENYRNKLLELSLPLSVDSQAWPNLQTLRLVGFKLDDISFIESFKALEILELRASHFKEIPEGILELKRLKLLDLAWCQFDEKCYTIIGRIIPKLQEIYQRNDPHRI